jgi:hypothetical protein
MSRAEQGGLPEGEGERLSAGIVAACKALVPVNYTTASAFGHDLALGATPLPSLRPPKPVIAMSDDELWGATHGLRRAVNRVRAGIQEAAGLLDAANEA